ncbi:MAG TPA: nitroreductase family protein, partial [Candidatus Hodarchaeales archaeon]|nr:nitroreductase family protein [Candidatus Hodarchaeales archaeon]
EWLRDLAPLGTTWEKPFIDTVPCLIVVFKQEYGLNHDTKSKHYYVNESVGIAVGMLILAIHNAGLVTLTHTPSPMGFLREILKRPINEKPYVLMPVGYPAEKVSVPALRRKEIDQFVVWKA